ncbi:ATP-binding cassette domain-containing protein [Novosphingobium sp. AAP93]|uniref:ATP-binding cassette domain-containing protein n=1 Tax=Novosphingobium sp. AAP93 TaxID=1523427 RepID=UPI000ADA018C|nr:ATP-binding cassette domain-containing protein [Novosphingobium sp. AAP93]
MIRLDNVSLAYQRGRNVIDGFSIDLPSHRRLAILGGPETGKTTLIGLLAGVVDPTAGRIERRAHLSFPAGYIRAFRMSNTVRQNIIFAARIYDADPGEVVSFICESIDISELINVPMRDVPIRGRLLVAYALTYALPFDTYLFDNMIGPGDPATRDLWRQLYEARTASAGAIVATRQSRVAEAYCDCALVLRRDASPIFFENLRDGIALFEADAAAGQQADAAGLPTKTGALQESEVGSLGDQAMVKVPE